MFVEGKLILMTFFPTVQIYLKEMLRFFCPRVTMFLSLGTNSLIMRYAIPRFDPVESSSGLNFDMETHDIGMLHVKKHARHGLHTHTYCAFLHKPCG